MNRWPVCAIAFFLAATAACADFTAKPVPTLDAGVTGGGGMGVGTGGTTSTTGTGGGAVASGGTTGTTVPPPTTGGTIAKVDLKGKRVLFIVDDPASLDDGDIMLRDILAVGRDMVVTMGDTAGVNPEAATMNLIIASSGASAAEFATLYKEAAVPMILFGNTTYQAMGIIAASSGKGTVSTPVMLTIATAAAPLTSSLAMGTIFSAIGTARSTSVYWGTPGGSPINVATVMGVPTQSVAFAYEKGSAMAAGTAAGRRVGLGFKTDVVPDLSIESFRLLNAAIEWTAGAPP